MKTSSKFGPTVRKKRLAKEFGLRQFAATVGMSPTYLSKVERDEFPPPAEEKVKAIAEALELNPDKLLALAGRVASDLPEIIRAKPEWAAFLRRARHLHPDEIKSLTNRVKKH